MLAAMAVPSSSLRAEEVIISFLSMRVVSEF
jgi:hypothetical protein